MTHLAIYASGSGTNAENIIRYFKNHLEISVKIVLCNNPDAFVIERAKRLEMPCIVFPKGRLDGTMSILSEYEIDYIILAGFLLKLPKKMIEAYRGRIINIHPALIPSKYGGKGMYGMHVHNAVIAAGEKESGITIHLVMKSTITERIFSRYAALSMRMTHLRTLPRGFTAWSSSIIHEL